MSEFSARIDGDLDGKLHKTLDTNKIIVSIVIDKRVASEQSAQHTAWMVINLLCRHDDFIKKIIIDCSEDIILLDKVMPAYEAGRSFKSAIIDSVNDVGMVEICEEKASGVVLAISKEKNMSCDYYVMGNGWCGGLSVDPIIIGELSKLPFGPYIAACLAVGELFKRARQIDYVEMKCVFYNCWEHSASTFYNANGPTDIPKIILDHLLAGVGAVGSAFLYSIWACSELHGKVVLADNDKKGVESSNLQRYILFTKKSLGEMKASEAAKLLNNCEIEFRPHDKPVEYIDRDNIPKYLISAVDKNTSRHSIQHAFYPERLFSASTYDLRLEVVRCGPPGDGACLACYNPVENAKDDVQLRNEFRGSTKSEISELCAELNIREDDVREWLDKQSCGETGSRVLSYLRRNDDEPESFSVGFVSMQCGVILAAEVVKDYITKSVPLNSKEQRVVFQHWNPMSRVNKSSIYKRDVNCKVCAPDTTAFRVWKKRFMDSLVKDLAC